MNSEFGTSSAPAVEADPGHSGADRRSEGERRRSARGWFELRARRDGVATDRRQAAERRSGAGRVLLGFWRRGGA